MRSVGRILRSNWLLVIPLLFGILLMASAWFLSYPLLIVSPDDWIFNHISSLYWIGLPLTVVSLYAIGLRSHSYKLQCVVALGIFLAINSLSYYYSMLPGSDAQLFRGLNEYYSKSDSLVADNKWHFYYEFPVFFVFTRIIGIVTGLELVHLEFFLYTLIGSMIVLGFFMFYSANNKKLVFLPVVGFAIAMFSFFNYQAVPFSLASSLLILMLAIEKKFEFRAVSRSKTVLILLLFVSVSFTHVFVSVFFILYLIAQYLLNRNPKYLRLILITVVIYSAVQFFHASVSLDANVQILVDNILSSDLSKVVEQTFIPNPSPIDALAQTFSRISFFLVTLVCGFGFLLLLLKKRLTNVDKAFLFSGLIYLVLGVFLPILGSRAIAFVFIPVSMGVFFFFRGRKEVIMKIVLLVGLVLFTFVSMHSTFIGEVQFQTKEAYAAENFMLKYYAWNQTAPPKVVIDFRQQNYLVAFEANRAYFYGEKIANFSELKEYDCVIYTVGLAKILAAQNITIVNSIENSSFHLIYSNGFTNSFVNSVR